MAYEELHNRGKASYKRTDDAFVTPGIPAAIADKSIRKTGLQTGATERLQSYLANPDIKTGNGFGQR